MKRLKKILQCNNTYYYLLTICFIYIIIFLHFYKCNNIYDLNDKYFSIKIFSYKIDGNKLRINTNHLICYYYFNSLEEKKLFINNYSIGDTINVYGVLTI